MTDMTTDVPPLTQRNAWKALEAHFEKIRDVHLRTLFDEDPQRGRRLSAEAGGLYLDYSKHRVTDETLKLLVQLAEESGLRERIDAMFRGEKINITENRAVLHVALRAPNKVLSSWMVTTSCSMFIRYSTGWPIFQIAFAAEIGKDIPASESRM